MQILVPQLLAIFIGGKVKMSCVKQILKTVIFLVALARVFNEGILYVYMYPDTSAYTCLCMGTCACTYGLNLILLFVRKGCI